MVGGRVRSARDTLSSEAVLRVEEYVRRNLVTAGWNWRLKKTRPLSSAKIAASGRGPSLQGPVARSGPARSKGSRGVVAVTKFLFGSRAPGSKRKTQRGVHVGCSSPPTRLQVR